MAKINADKGQEYYRLFKQYMIKEDILQWKGQSLWLDLKMLKYKAHRALYQYWIFRVCLREPRMSEVSFEESSINEELSGYGGDSFQRK